MFIPLRGVVFCVFLLFAFNANADGVSLISALQNAYTACVGIDESLADLKKMAGINTVVTGVGTGLGAGATIVGIVKEQTDKEIEKFERYIKELDAAAARQTMVPSEIDVSESQIDDLFVSVNQQKGINVELEKLNKKSKTLGNWRTGLLAGNTVTNVAGAIIAGKNTTDGDLQNQIDNCKTAISELRRARGRARIDGVDVGEANKIISACEGFETVDISKMNTRAKGAMISGIVGATTGLTGTITSGIANSDSVRDKGEDGTRTDKEKNLNIASNVLAGASTVASATATVFNATQISAIKKVSDVATKCTEALR